MNKTRNQIATYQNEIKLPTAPNRIYIGQASRVRNYTVWAHRVLNSGYKVKKRYPILLNPTQFNTYKPKSNRTVGERGRKFLVSVQASYIRTQTLPNTKQNKNTQGRTSCAFSNIMCTLLHWSIVPTFKRRQMRKIHTSNDKTNSCHVTEAATHTGSTALTALSVCFAGFEVNLAGRTVMGGERGGWTVTHYR